MVRGERVEIPVWFPPEMESRAGKRVYRCRVELCRFQSPMKNLNLERFLFIILAFSAIVWFADATANRLSLAKLPDFLRLIPDVVTMDLVAAALFFKWGWRWPVLHGWLVPFPDLNGTWQGELQTSWKDDQGRTPRPIAVLLTIRQSFTGISCVMRTAEMESRSYAEGFCLDEERQIRKLAYSYTSRPKISLRSRSTPHDGTIVFNIIEHPVRKLEGEYWTQRQTTGTVTLTFRTKTLLEELPTDFPAHPMAAAGN